MEKSSLAGWLPVALNPFDRTLLTVGVDDPEAVRLDLPFYHHAIEHLQANGAPERTFELDQLDSPSSTRPLGGFVFHASRCGSTLVAQAIATMAGHTVIAEAQPINASLYLRDDRQRLTVTLLRAMCQWRPNDQVFIKQTSINVTRGARHLADFPNANWVFVYRDPVEIMVSIARSDAGWSRARHEPSHAARLLRVSDDISQMATEDYYGLAIDCMFRAALELDTGRGLFIDYADLNLDGLVAVLEHLGVDVTEERRATVQASMQVYSKDRQRRRAHVGDRASKQAMATPSMRTAAERTHDALDELRARSWRPRGCMP